MDTLFYLFLKSFLLLHADVDCPNLIPYQQANFTHSSASSDVDGIALLKASIRDEYLDSFGGNNPAVWNEEAILHALEEGFRSTQDLWFADKLLSHFDALLAKRDDRLKLVDYYRKRMVKGWGTPHYTAGNRHVWGVHAALLTYPVLALSRLLLSQPALRCSAYGYRVMESLERAKETIAEFDEDWGNTDGSSGSFRFPKTFPEMGGIPAAGRPLPFNMIFALAQSHLELYALTGEVASLDKAKKSIGYFRRYEKIIPLSRTIQVIEWPYWAANPKKMEDTSHGGITANFAGLSAKILSPEQGFSPLEIKAFTYTLMKRISNYSLFFTFNIDGTGGYDPSKFIPERACGNWMALSEWNHHINEYCQRIRVERGISTPLSLARELSTQ